jgi:UDPglucose--hexose-1-phosphate uridylyltransferase
MHAITGDPLLFAPERAARRGAFGETSNERCPFCPGHETDTPPEVAHIGEPWRVRTFPNKYPPVAGAEVIVESGRHDADFDGIDHAGDVVRMYADRYRAHSGAACVALFKNEGAAAGSSIDHPHSQVVPLPFVPPRVEREAAAFARASACPLCAGVEGNSIGETASFMWLTPRGSWMPYQQWIVPKRHASELGALTGDESEQLGDLLRAASKAMSKLADACNWCFVSFRGQPSAHWYLDLFPRMTAIAGLELGTGTFVEIIDPAAAAARLRQS